ncbi:family 43 glycosylhydrolase [Candidatus Aerophobetes bacterium]|nr:family 43 glycosylhydrolase [Candidatus Aerophobetes bacterium]
MIGPFRDFEENPILVPGQGFYSKGAYNPAVIKNNGIFFMLYRAEATNESLTGRIGLAKSINGFNFTPYPHPVLTPGEDFDRFGCEDPRIIRIGDTFYLTYVGNPGRYEVGNICLAISKDLIHWKKHGSIFKPESNWNKGQVKAGAILPEKINGKYFMYFMGENEPWKTAIGLATSSDLFQWDEPLKEPVLYPRKGYFDSKGVEPGPPPILTKEGIWLIYSGWGDDHTYKVGAALFSRDDPAKIIKRTEKPILYTKTNWGDFFGGISNHTVPEGLVIEKEHWLLYYGAADRACCVALWNRGGKE